MREQTVTPAQLITREEAKKILLVSARTVDRLVERNQLPTVRIPTGRAVRFRLTSIEEFVTHWEHRPAVVENNVNITGRPHYPDMVAACIAAPIEQSAIVMQGVSQAKDGSRPKKGLR